MNENMEINVYHLIYMMNVQQKLFHESETIDDKYMLFQDQKNLNLKNDEV